MLATLFLISCIAYSILLFKGLEEATYEEEIIKNLFFLTINWFSCIPGVANKCRRKEDM